MSDGLAQGPSAPGEGAPAPVRVLVVDDHEVVRLGLRRFLELDGGIRVVGEASGAAEAVDEAVRLQPDVVLLDVRLPDGSGIDACRAIRARLPGTRVLVLTSYADEHALLDAVVAGASGFLLKHVRGREIITAIHAVRRGESLFDERVAGSIRDRLRGAGDGSPRREFAHLTDQERRVLGWLAEGKTNREIAAVAGLSEKTVKHYVSSVLAKLDVGRRTQAAAKWAAAHGAPGAGSAAGPGR